MRHRDAAEMLDTERHAAAHGPAWYPRRPLTDRRKRAYRHELPLLIASLTALGERLREHPSGVNTLILFGSVARLTPDTTSDTDLLALFDLADAPDRHAAEEEAASDLYRNILDALYPKGYQWPSWGASLVTSDAQASDLDEDFVANVGREGVLLYLRPGGELPEALTRLMPFAEWAARVEALLVRCAS